MSTNVRSILSRRGRCLPAMALSIMGMAMGCTSTEPEFVPWELDELTGTDGFSIRVPEFEVASGRESQNCYFMRVPDINNGGDVWIGRILTAINPGSHHMNVFRVKTILNLDPAAGAPIKLGAYDGTVIEGSDDYLTNPCWDSANWGDWPLISNSQHADPKDPFTDWTLPDGVAHKLVPGEMLMIQTHYVNSTDQPTKFGARVGINMYSYTGTAAPLEMGTLFATQQNIRVCKSNPTVTYSGTCRFPSAVTVAAANGHFHKRGVGFEMFPWDGQTTAHPAENTVFYSSNSWEEPPMTFDLSIGMPTGTGVWWDCAYQWHEPDLFTCADVDEKDPLKQGDCCYTFGGNTDVGEHCNVFLYYYPKVNTDIFCL